MKIINEFLELALVVVIAGVCVVNLALLMREWSIPMVYNTDKSVITLTSDIEQDIINTGVLTGADIKALLIAADGASPTTNRIKIITIDAAGTTNSSYETITMSTDWLKNKGANIQHLCTDASSWNLDNILHYKVVDLQYDYDYGVWVYTLKEG